MISIRVSCFGQRVVKTLEILIIILGKFQTWRFTGVPFIVEAKLKDKDFEHIGPYGKISRVNTICNNVRQFIKLITILFIHFSLEFYVRVIFGFISDIFPAVTYTRLIAILYS